MLRPPDQIDHLLRKPGIEWTAKERDEFFRWLSDKASLSYLARLAAKNLSADCNFHDAEDAVMSMIYYMYNWIPTLTSAPPDLCAVIVKKLKQTCLDLIKKKKNSREDSNRPYSDFDVEEMIERWLHSNASRIEQSDNDPQQRAFDSELWRVVQKCLESVPDWLQIVEFYYLSDLSAVEVASRVGWFDPQSVNRVNYRLKSAYKSLFKCRGMQEYLGLIQEEA